VDEEYRSARESVVVGDRSYRARVRVTGKDRVGFLHNMLTNDVKQLVTGEGMPAALLTRLGKLVSDLIVYQLGEAVLLEMEPEGRDAVLESLSRYIVSEDVTLTDVNSEENLFSVEGPRAAKLLAELLETDRDQDEERLAELPAFHFISARFDQRPIRLSAARHGPGAAFDVAVPVETAIDFLERLLEDGRPLGLRLAGWRALEIRRIEAGIPLLGTDMDASHLPLEAGLEEAISFTKGCYIGQEYVVRLAHRGHLNRKLAGIVISGRTVPKPADEIQGAGQTVGRVTSAAFSPTLEHPIAMGYLQRDFLPPGTALSILSNGSELAARVTELPFIRRP